jgi:hypothetical protein
VLASLDQTCDVTSPVLLLPAGLAWLRSVVDCAQLLLCVCVKMRAMLACALISVARGEEGAPCDTYGSVGTPCVGAYSLLRAMYSAYDGPLYFVRRASDNTTRAVSVRSAGGFADTSTQVRTCASEGVVLLLVVGGAVCSDVAIWRK